MTSGHKVISSKSPRPAGPRARAPTRLVTTLHSKIVQSVTRISLALRMITLCQFPLSLGEGVWACQFRRLSTTSFEHRGPSPCDSPAVALLDRLRADSACRIRFRFAIAQLPSQRNHEGLAQSHSPRNSTGTAPLARLKR